MTSTNSTNNTARIIRHTGPEAERDALIFLMQILVGLLDQRSCEKEIERRWGPQRHILHAPGAAEALWHTVQSIGEERQSTYGADCKEVNFRSKWLVSNSGVPGVIYIDAPPEQVVAESQVDGLNRGLHRHDSGRAALIIRGNPVFHYVADDEGGNLSRFRVSLVPGDLIFWPRDVSHTFNAMEGFALLSIMSSYVGPEEDGFSYSSPSSDINCSRSILVDLVQPDCL